MTFCDQISDETKVEMKKLIRYTKETGNEHGIMLCRIGNKIVNSEMCAGDKCSISSDAFGELFCPENSEYVSIFHTHPLEEGDDIDIYETPSEGDIVGASQLSHNYTCISASKNNTYCYKIPKKNIDLADIMWQKSDALDDMKEWLDKRIDEGADDKEINSINEGIYIDDLEFKRAQRALEIVSTLYFFSPKLIENRCKVDLDSNANGEVIP